jgi:uncharacterized protein (TIGR03435 family)
MNNEQRFREFLGRALKPSFNAPQDQVDSSCERVLQRLQETSKAPVDDVHSAHPAMRRRLWPAVALAAAIVAIVVLLPARVVRSAPAILEDSAGSRTIDYDQVVSPSGAEGGTLKLQDGSSVEIRSESEVSLGRSEDGVLVRLRNGAVIVNAAERPAGVVTVETRDVSAVGAVFLVNAEEGGSRVAAIGGEARVQQGANERKLQPGEQVSTNPTLQQVPVKTGIAWSRNADTHMAMLEQATLVVSRQNPTGQAGLSFEVGSVRPTASAAGGQRGTGGGGSPRPLDEPCGNPSGNNRQSNFFLQIDGRRFAAQDATLHALIGWAYNIDCPVWRGLDGVLGGPGWSKTAGFDVEATIPQGTPVYTKKQFLDGQAPELQKMLQTLLAERFQLAFRRETREMPALVLSIASGGLKLKEWKQGDPPTFNEWYEKLGWPSEPEMMRQARELGQLDRGWFMGFKTPWPDFVAQLKRSTDRPVVDRTSITAGEYTFIVQYSRSLSPSGLLTLPQGTTPIHPPTAPSLSHALEQELGLKLEATRVPTEVLVIERVEKPSEN